MFKNIIFKRRMEFIEMVIYTFNKDVQNILAIFQVMW